MAIQIATTHRGLTAPTAYARIGNMHLTGKTEVTAHLNVYASVEAKGGEALECINVPFTLDISERAPSIHRQAYAAAKLLYPAGRDV